MKLRPVGCTASLLALAAVAGASIHQADVDGDSMRVDLPPGDKLPDKLPTPTCESAGIADDAACLAHCAGDGHDGEWYAFAEVGVSCKCDTSEPGDEFDAYDYVTVCYTPAGMKTEEVKGEEGAAAQMEEEEKKEEDEAAYGATTYPSKETPKCYCGDVELACDRIDIECGGVGSSGSSRRDAVGMLSVAAGAVAAMACVGLL